MTEQGPTQGVVLLSWVQGASGGGGVKNPTRGPGTSLGNCSEGSAFRVGGAQRLGGHGGLSAPAPTHSPGEESGSHRALSRGHHSPIPVLAEHNLIDEGDLLFPRRGPGLTGRNHLSSKWKQTGGP